MKFKVINFIRNRISLLLYVRNSSIKRSIRLELLIVKFILLLVLSISLFLLIEIKKNNTSSLNRLLKRISSKQIQYYEKIRHRYWYFYSDDFLAARFQSSVEEQIETTQITQRHCAANEVLEALAADPALRKRMADIEVYTQK